MIVSRLLLERRKRPPHRRHFAQRLKKIRRDQGSFYILRIAFAGKIGPIPSPTRKLLKRPAPCFPIEVIRGRNWAPSQSWIGVRGQSQRQHDTVRLGERNRLAQKRNRHAENSRVRSDAQRQRHYRKCREPRTFQQHPESIPYVLPKCSHGYTYPRML